MSWSDYHRALFFKSVCEYPPLGDSFEENAETIRGILNSSLKRFQKKFTLNDIVKEILKSYNVKAVANNGKDNQEEESEAEANKESHGGQTVDHKVVDKQDVEPSQDRSANKEINKNEADHPSEPEHMDAPKLEPQSGPESEQEQEQEPEPEQDLDQELEPLRTRSGRRRKRSPDHEAIQDAEPATKADTGRQDAKVDYPHSEEAGGSASDSDDEQDLDDANSETGGEENADEDPGNVGSDALKKDGLVDQDLSESEKPRSRRISRAARPSMTRSSLSPQRRTRQTAQRAKTEESAPAPSARVAKSNANNLKRTRTLETQREVSDSESEDLPPAKRRTRQTSSRRSPAATSAPATTGRRVGARKKNEATLAVGSASSRTTKKATPEPKTTRKGTSTKVGAKPNAQRGKPVARRGK